MLTPRENLLEVMHGGHPDRFVNQYEPFAIQMKTPMSKRNPAYGELNVTDDWGVTRSWPIGTPGAFPVHDEEHIVIKDMEHWRDYVKAPAIVTDPEAWKDAAEAAAKVDRSKYFVTTFYAPGIFEQCHYLMEITNCLMNFYEYPDEMHEVIDMITEYELGFAEQVCKYVKPDALFHHDDWGSQISTFLSPSMFEEFFLEPYKKLYGYYKAHGVQVIVHHSDSYAKTLMPYMVEMGIDIWQGVMKSNNIAECIKEYGGKLTFMGGVDSAEVDNPHWTEEIVAQKVREACESFGKLYFIPGASQGLPMSTYEGVYDCMTREIDKMSAEMFK